MATTEAQKKAVRAYQQRTYDRVSVLLPIGTKERIAETGATLNGFVAAAVLDALDHDASKPCASENVRASKPETCASNDLTRASKDDARASKVIALPCDLWEKLRGYGDPEKIVLTAAEYALEMYDVIM